jgi:hypothetical protein
LFDFLSRKLHGIDLHQIRVSLSVDSTSDSNYISENYFRTMYDWKCKYPNIDHKEKLKEVLSGLGRHDLAVEIDAFSKMPFSSKMSN